MKEINITSWSHFEEKITELEESINSDRKENDQYISDLLFRGQADSRWLLLSTLDRKLNQTEMSMEEYQAIILGTAPNANKFLGTPLELDPNYKAKDLPDFYNEHGIEWLKLMAYLRHHGFPTPLLDWTTSVDVATFFAFRNAADVSSVSIYAFIEYAGAGKDISPAKHQIHGIGPKILTHYRHERQKSQYTFCVNKKGNEQYYYSCHENVIIRNEQEQDLFFKFIIPIEIRTEALSNVFAKGLNASHLFGDSEDNLMSDLEFELFDINFPSREKRIPCEK